MPLSQLQRLAAQAIVSVFETGRPTGGYGQVTLLAGDSGRLTYGRFQTTLASGALYFLIKDYVERPGAAHVRTLSKYLGRLMKKDPALDHDRGFRRLLKKAGDDPVMRQAQDDFFERNYWVPAVKAAETLGVSTPLGVAVIYDSKVHGSFERICARTIRQVGRPASTGEEAWIAAYVATRRDWLAHHAQPILRKTVYRMKVFERLIRDDNWDLDLPFKVGRFRIDEATLRGERPSGRRRILVPADEPITGEDVRHVQARLTAWGHPTEPTGAYDEPTVKAVRTFQAAHGLKVDGCVGPVTLSALDAARPAPAKAHANTEPTPAPLPAAPGGPSPASASALRRAARKSPRVLAGALDLAGPWLARYSLAPVATVGAVSAALSEFGDRLPSPEALKTSSVTWIASRVQPPYEWFMRTVPEDAARVLALAALLWIVVALIVRRDRRHA